MGSVLQEGVQGRRALVVVASGDNWMKEQGLEKEPQ